MDKPGEVSLARDFRSDCIDPLTVQGRLTAQLGMLAYGPEQHGTRKFFKDAAGQWTAFRDTFKLPDDGTLNDWYKNVHRIILEFVRGEIDLLGLFAQLKALGEVIGLTMKLEVHDLR